MYEGGNTNRSETRRRLVFAASYIAAVGVLCTPTIERPHLRLPSFLRFSCEAVASVFYDASSCHMIRIFVTGGTFDKTYDEIRGGLSFGDTHLTEMLRLGRSRVDVAVRTLMMVDSLDMTDADRELIVRNCLHCPESRIVITHGTDTMVETARALAAGVQGKTVVLTGAMIPYAFGSSDGLFNLGSALSLAQVLPPGVYIAMNGQHFSWDRVRKNRETGVFEAL